MGYLGDIKGSRPRMCLFAANCGYALLTTLLFVGTLIHLVDQASSMFVAVLALMALTYAAKTVLGFMAFRRESLLIFIIFLALVEVLFATQNSLESILAAADDVKKKRKIELEESAYDVNNQPLTGYHILRAYNRRHSKIQPLCLVYDTLAFLVGTLAFVSAYLVLQEERLRRRRDNEDVLSLASHRTAKTATSIILNKPASKSQTNLTLQFTPTGSDLQDNRSSVFSEPSGRPSSIVHSPPANQTNAARTTQNNGQRPTSQSNTQRATAQQKGAPNKPRPTSGNITLQPRPPSAMKPPGVIKSPSQMSAGNSSMASSAGGVQSHVSSSALSPPSGQSYGHSGSVPPQQSTNGGSRPPQHTSNRSASPSSPRPTGYAV